MRLVLNLYLISTQVSLISFAVCALWGLWLSFRARWARNYLICLGTSYIILLIASVLLVTLGLMGADIHVFFAFMYSFIAFMSPICVYTLFYEEATRYQLLTLSIACAFSSAMIVRALEVL